VRSLILVAACLASACNSRSTPGLQASGGAEIYAKLCASCHAQDGKSLASLAPPLAGHAVSLLQAGGRSHLIRIVLNGMAGPIQVGGRSYDAMMTPLRYLKDQQVADVLNHVLSAWGNDKLLPSSHRPVTAEEVARVRLPVSSPQEMAAHRPPLPSSPPGSIQ
jgi:mono/diheme cytochrome c family protein